ncbi:MAG: alpha/beta fold hydrolase, partial [Gammaproteobacteria bacterium]|nr:alpha/beta fold hydrolase [Gammaproteobacteria bacterium]
MLFPAIQPGDTWQFAVSDRHSLYVEECGNPEGIPVVFLHGGPGGSCEAGHRRFFDPKRYRIILFDQRGSGKSKPHASLESNTTADLVEDLEKIREFLNIDRWVVFGGSWGSTLSLIYAQTHP